MRVGPLRGGVLTRSTCEFSVVEAFRFGIIDFFSALDAKYIVHCMTQKKLMIPNLNSLQNYYSLFCTKWTEKNAGLVTFVQVHLVGFVGPLGGVCRSTSCNS